MVTITNYFVRQNKDGKPFIALELTGDIEVIQSATTGRFYMTAKRCNISSTFPEEVAKLMIGKTLRGRIDRVETAAYEYTVKETGEVVTLAHTYMYVPEERQPTMVAAPSNVLVAQ